MDGERYEIPPDAARAVEECRGPVRSEPGPGPEPGRYPRRFGRRDALAAADAVLVPLQCEFFALEGLAQLLSTVDTLQHGYPVGIGDAGDRR